MASLLLLLLVVVAAAASDCGVKRQLLDGSGGHQQCGPQLQLGQLSGFQMVTVLPPRGCSCTLSLSLLTVRSSVAPPELTCVREEGWFKLVSGTTSEGSINYRVVYAGWYLPRARNCTCNVPLCHGGVWDGPQWQYEHGLRADSWNVTLSAVVLADCSFGADNCRLNVSVDRQLLAGSSTTQVFFPELKMRLEKVPSGYTETKRLSWSPDGHAPVQFDHLSVGDYEIEVKPVVFNCQGAQNGCPRRHVEVSVIPTYDYQPVKLAPADQLGKAVYIAAGVLGGLTVAALVLCFIWKTRRGEWRLSGVGPPPGLEVTEKWSHWPAAPVIVFQCGSCGEDARAGRRRLLEALRDAGLCPLDAQQGELLRWIHSRGTVADLLTLPELSAAKLLFIADDPCVAEPGAAARHADAIYESALCHVRNTQYGQDYQRVYLCTVLPGSSGEVMGLTEGRVFRVVEESDLSLLVSHLRIPAPDALPWVDTASSQLLLASSTSSSEETV